MPIRNRIPGCLETISVYWERRLIIVFLMGFASGLPFLSLLCNKAHTGTQYALFTSFMAFGRTWLSAISGWVADQTDWVTFFITSTFVALPGLLLLLWMLKHLPMAEQAGPDR